MVRTIIAALAALLPCAAAWGLCNDKHPSCGHWAKTGECDKDNVKFMQANCPLACGMCPLVCRDTDDACAAWAKEGHCESNPTFMMKTCPTSCKVCATKCYDKEPDKCGDWARGGECLKNPAIMSTCPISCGVCQGVCLDKRHDCPMWAASDACNENKEFMMRECPNSCGVCEREKDDAPQAPCKNHNQKQCILWGEQECAVNPLSMLALCPEMCGVCTTACVDKSPDCVGWAKGHEGTACDKEPHLQMTCPASCVRDAFARLELTRKGWGYGKWQRAHAAKTPTLGLSCVAGRVRGYPRQDAARQGGAVIDTRAVNEWVGRTVTW